MKALHGTIEGGARQARNTGDQGDPSSPQLFRIDGSDQVLLMLIQMREQHVVFLLKFFNGTHTDSIPRRLSFVTIIYLRALMATRMASSTTLAPGIPWIIPGPLNFFLFSFFPLSFPTFPLFVNCTVFRQRCRAGCRGLDRSGRELHSLPSNPRPQALLPRPALPRRPRLGRLAAVEEAGHGVGSTNATRPRVTAPRWHPVPGCFVVSRSGQSRDAPGTCQDAPGRPRPFKTARESRLPLRGPGGAAVATAGGKARGLVRGGNDSTCATTRCWRHFPSPCGPASAVRAARRRARRGNGKSHVPQSTTPTRTPPCGTGRTSSACGTAKRVDYLARRTPPARRRGLSNGTGPRRGSPALPYPFNPSTTA